MCEPYGAPADLAEDLAAELRRRLTGVGDGAWEVPVHHERLPVTEDTRNADLLAHLGHLGRNRHWDLTVCIVDVPMRANRRPIVADAHLEGGTALVSLPAFGAMHLGRRVREVAEFVIRAYARPARSTEETRSGEVGAAALTRPFERIEPEVDGIDLRVLATRGRWRLLIGMVRANRPWRLVFGLTGALAAALAIGAYVLINSAEWELALALGPSKLAVATVFAIALMVTWLILDHHLWTSPAHSRRARLYNASTVLKRTVGSMPTFRSPVNRALTVLGTTASLVLTAGLTAGEASAASDFDFVNDASYILTLRAGAVEPYTLIPRYLPMDVGHSYVDLTHDLGTPQGRCEAIGAGYWLGTELEEAVLGPGFAPPEEDGTTPVGYRNPTISRTVRPDLNPAGQENPTDKTPAVPADGNGPLWQSSCASGEQGAATGDVVNAAGVRVAGSTTSAKVDRSTGRYTGTSRAYATGIEGAGALDTVSSLMQVVNEPNKKPVITYRISFYSSDMGGQDSAFSQNGFTVSGTNVPADQLVKQFNEQAKAAGAALATVGPMGFSLLAPQVRTSTNGNRFEIVAPVVQSIAGSHLRDGTAGEESGLRFGSTAFTGVYGEQD